MLLVYFLWKNICGPLCFSSIKYGARVSVMDHVISEFFFFLLFSWLQDLVLFVDVVLLQTTRGSKMLQNENCVFWCSFFIYLQSGFNVTLIPTYNCDLFLILIIRFLERPITPPSKAIAIWPALPMELKTHASVLPSFQPSLVLLTSSTVTQTPNKLVSCKSRR